LHRLGKLGEVEHVHWGWYYISEKHDVWDFLANDKGFKVLIKQMEKKVFDVKATKLDHNDIKELVEEAVDRVMEFS